MLHMAGAEHEDFRCPMDTKTSKKDAAKAPTRQNTARESQRSGGGNLSIREFKKNKNRSQVVCSGRRAARCSVTAGAQLGR